MVGALLVSFALGLTSAQMKSPAQYFYTNKTAASVTSKSGCKVTSWEGTDADGMAGYPWLSTIVCPEGATFQDEGVVAHGHIRFYLRYGSLLVNDATDPDNVQTGKLDTMGSAFWAADGVRLSVSLEGPGFAYIIGAKYELREDRNNFFSSSYLGPRLRVYDVLDAINPNNTVDAGNHHDPHICNGTTNARDLTWSSGASHVEPPSIAVLNCHSDAVKSAGKDAHGREKLENGVRGSTGSYVWFHFHPQGAVYLPYTGRICFEAATVKCVDQGDARWTSPNLYYYETFARLPLPVSASRHDPAVLASHAASRVVNMAFPSKNASDCLSPAAGAPPVVFGVTNFDPADPAGQPNFDDVPANGIRGKRFGVFTSMTVRTTTVVSKSIAIDSDGDEL